MRTVCNLGVTEAVFGVFDHFAGLGQAWLVVVALEVVPTFITLLRSSCRLDYSPLTHVATCVSKHKF